MANPMHTAERKGNQMDKGSNDAMQKAKDVGSDAMHKAKDVGSDALGKAKDVGSNAMETAKEIGGQAFDKAKSAATSVGEMALEGASTQDIKPMTSRRRPATKFANLPTTWASECQVKEWPARRQKS